MIRTGIGIDVHSFAPDRPLILGGVHIEHDLGLSGHSDADVLTHAIIDALLGAAALGDIGQHFPDDDPRYLNADSLVLLGEVMELISRAGFNLVNIDATVMLERPRLSQHREPICLSLANVLDVDCSHVSVKATTAEKMGFVGRGEGIATVAIATLEQRSAQ